MTPVATRGVAFCALLSVTLILLSCSSGNAVLRPGTPAFYWAAAQETYAAGDYQKTVEHLGNIVSTQNEYVERAQPWLLVMTSGMADGYMQLADAYEACSHVNRAQTTTIHKLLADYRSNSNTLALQFADNLAKFQPKDESVTLAFKYPTGSPNEVALLTKISKGSVPAPAEIETAQKRTIERAILLATCRAAGAEDNPAKAQGLMQTADAKVPRTVFLQSMAASLFDQSQLYSRNKLDDPAKMRILCTRAQETLKMVPGSKTSDDLNKKIQTALKKAKG